MKYKVKEKSGSGINIDPKNKGKFTATKKETGKSTAELTHSKNPLTKKRAIFAQNSKKWKHGDGGELKKPTSSPGVLDTVTIVAKKPVYKESMTPVRSLQELRDTYGDFPSTPNARVELQARHRGENFMPTSWITKPKININPKLEQGGELKTSKDPKIVDKGRKGINLTKTYIKENSKLDKNYLKKGGLTKHYIKEVKNKPGDSNIEKKKFANGGTISNIFEISKILEIWKQ